MTLTLTHAVITDDSGHAIAMSDIARTRLCTYHYVITYAETDVSDLPGSEPPTNVSFVNDFDLPLPSLTPPVVAQVRVCSQARMYVDRVARSRSCPPSPPSTFATLSCSARASRRMSFVCLMTTARVRCVCARVRVCACRLCACMCAR
jgi:hypothetical protein